MPKTYKISAENAAEIEEVRKTNTDKKWTIVNKVDK